MVGIVNSELVASIAPPRKVVAIAFERGEGVRRIFTYLGREPAFPAVTVNDLERELYRQFTGSELIEVTCDEEPECDVTVRGGDDDPTKAVVTDFTATLLVTAKLRLPGGAEPLLKVSVTYTGSDLDDPDKRRLRADFAEPSAEG